jgi:hypothetical protein
MEIISTYAKEETSVESKINEFISFIGTSEMNISNDVETKSDPTNAVILKLDDFQLISEFKKIDDDALSRLEKLEKIEGLLQNNFIDTNIAKSIIVKRYLEMIVPVCLGIVMLTLGFAMIIMPAPAYFEMFTIFHFTENDGVTLMDLISLIIVLTGVFVIIKSYFKFANQY